MRLQCKIGVFVVVIASLLSTAGSCGKTELETAPIQSKVASYGGDVMASMKVAQDFIVKNSPPIPEKTVGAAQNLFLRASKAGLRLADLLQLYDQTVSAVERAKQAPSVEAALAEITGSLNEITGLFTSDQNVGTEVTRLVGNTLKIISTIRTEIRPSVPTPTP